MASAKECPAPVGMLRQGKARRRNAVRRAQHRHKDGLGEAFVEEAEQGRRPVVSAEAVEELGVADEAAPAPADEGGAGEGGRERRQAEQDLLVHVVVVRQGRRRRRFTTLSHLDERRPMRTPANN
jgi:hypothetical protein